MNETFNRLDNAMSLRRPQAEALEILAKVVDAIPLVKTPDKESKSEAIGSRDSGDTTAAQTAKRASDNEAALAAIKALGYPIKDFERDFPSLCFSIATGVGKTRLMGAFISYLNQVKGIKNFFIVAPNLTIYNKLIADFTPNTPKYVFHGVPEFATKSPLVITGDNYQNMGGLTGRMYEDRVKINIFNISKINSEKDDRGTPRFRKFSEVLGESYFDYLQSLPDLVLLMDEAHRYRAKAGMKVINELAAVLGLELTATAHDEKGKQFANVVYHYALAQAVNDKYVKKPAIVGRTNFDKAAYDAERLEEIKLVDGFEVHEGTKARLEVYAAEHNVRRVKPFLLVVARDTAHANVLKDRVEALSDGKYKDKVIVVHSNQKGAELDENVALLLEVEKADNPIEVVIHVNMLAEGWDVNNLYTIVPLRTADSKTLVEQSIGRGLRLPYGKHTGVDVIDRLNIVAHDKFAEIVKVAEEQGFQFQQIALDNDNDITGNVAVDNTSSFLADVLAGKIDISAAPAGGATQGKLDLPKPNAEDIAIAAQIAKQMEEKLKVVNSVDEIKSAERVAEIVAEVYGENTEGKLALDDGSYKKKLEAMTAKIAEQFVERQIQIPPIRIVRAAPNVGVMYQKFALDLALFDGLKPIHQNILVREILENKREEQGEAVFTKQYKRPEDYIIIKLMDYLPCTSAEDIDLLDYLSAQVVKHIETYASGDDVEKILFFNNERIARDIAAQAEKHKSVPKIETKVKGAEDGYTSLRMRQNKLLGDKTEGEQSFRVRPRVLSKIKSYVYEGFAKCLSSKAKFDSDTERQLSVLLEDTPAVVRWERLNDDQAKDTFNLRYKKEGVGLAAYCPDFVVETNDAKYIVETKAADDMTAADVVAKKEIATRWCAEASKYEAAHGGKPWAYLLIPHNDLDPTRTFERLVVDWSVK
jgi:type III restriction enzyme